MKVIVTGATGFIGKHLCRALVEKGYEVVALSRNQASAEAKLGNAVKSIAWDGKTSQGWAEEAEGAYGIINLAGENIGASRWTPERKEKLTSSRLNSDHAVVEAIQKAQSKPKVLIQASGIGYYGDTGDEIVDETAPRGQGFLADLAYRWEEEVQQVQDQVRLVKLRTSAVLDAKEGALPKMLTPFKMYAGGPVGSGEQWFGWIHIQDEVGAILFLLENENLQGPFNLIAPGVVKQRVFSKALGETLGKPSWLPAPSLALKLMLGEMAQELLLSGQRATPKGLLEAGYEFLYPELDQALQNLLH